MNKQPLSPSTSGLTGLILVLNGILALREIYLGKLQWQYLYLLCFSLLFFYGVQTQRQRRQKQDAGKK